MAKVENKSKQNPKLQQTELKDGRASLYLEYYLGRSETPVLDERGIRCTTHPGQWRESLNTR